MAKQQETAGRDPERIAQVLAEIADRSQQLMQDFAERRCAPNGEAATADPLNLQPTILELTTRLMADPAALFQAQLALGRDYLRLWQSTSQRLWGQSVPAVAEPEEGDRRFRDPAWDESALFDFIKQSYLLTSRWLVGTVNQLEGLDDKTRQKIDFYTRQFVDAMAPSNFVATNPEVLRATLETGGENLLRGLNNLLGDLARGRGRLAIKMTDLDAFELGKNLALTPGKVVFQTELMQLIQYLPTTAQVHQRPLLIIPPWINKYYILDLQPKNSFIKYAVDQGFTVFVISWVNPDAEHAECTFEDYMLQGPLAALDAMQQATGESERDGDRLLPGRHAAGRNAGLARRQEGPADQGRDLLRQPGRFPAAGRARRVHRRGAARRDGRDDGQARLSRRPPYGDHLQHAARQRPDLVVRDQQLSARQGAVPVRSLVLEL